MGTISSTGLVSGLDIQSLIKQLLAVESRPLALVQQQIKKAQAEQTAYLELSARFSTSLTGLNRLIKLDTFRARSASSSNENVLSATANGNTAVGSYTFRVLRLATTHQLVSAGMPDRDRTSVGAGTLTFESAGGRLDTSTALSSLNGGAGVRQGEIRIIDREGNRTDLDLSGATTVDEVVEAINSQSDVNVQASIRGDQLVLTDVSASGTGALRVQDINGGHMAADFGIAGTFAGGEAVGQDLVRLTDSTRLSTLNDGLGVGSAGSTGDIRVTLSDGSAIDVNLSSNLQLGMKLAALNDGRGVADGTVRLTNRKGQTAEITVSSGGTLQDVVNAINGSGLSISAVLAGSKLILSDTTKGQFSNFKVEDVTGTAAADLGIKADVAADGITGNEIYQVDTLGDVFRAFQYAPGNDGKISLGISAEGNGIVLTDATSGGELTVESLNGSRAAEDLGLLVGTVNASSMASRALVAGLNTVLLTSLNGGRGVGTGVVQFTRRDGSTVQVDFAGARTLDDILSRINNATDGAGAAAGLTAAVTPGGTGITIQDSTAGAGSLSVADVSGTTASDLHLTSSAPNTLSSGDLQRKYISENTLLADLNGGEGIEYGSFRITTADGLSKEVTLLASTHRTIGDVIKAINSIDLSVSARLNANGDGLELVDESGGGGQLSVSEKGTGSVAASLGLSGQTAAGQAVLTGTFAKQIEITGSDTLDAIVTKINGADAGLRASVLNDGSAASPYRLVITSSASGQKGEIAFSSTVPGFSLDTMTQAQDAVLGIGAGSGANPMLVTSSTNTLEGLVDGMSLTLTGTSEEPITVTVGQDVDSLVEAMQAFIKGINDSMDRIGDLTKYDPETQQRGILLGDFAVQQIQSQVYSLLTTTATGKGLTFTSLTQIGLNIGNGATLSLDESKFRQAIEKDPEGVEKLFTLTSKDKDGKTVNQGIGLKLKDLIEQITDRQGGTIAQQNEAIQDRVDLYNQRVTHLQEMLARKETRLYNQFNNMELVLSQLQSQQTALANMAASFAAATGLK